MWIGATVSVVSLVSYFAFFARFPSFRDTAWLNLLGVALGLSLSGAALLRRRSWWSLIGLGVALASATALVGYVFFLSSQMPDDDGVIDVGDRAPSFALPDQSGHLVRLEDFRGSRLLIVFYRGFW